MMFETYFFDDFIEVEVYADSSRQYYVGRGFIFLRTQQYAQQHKSVVKIYCKDTGQPLGMVSYYIDFNPAPIKIFESWLDECSRI